MGNYQTITEFMAAPFGNKVPIINEYDKAYQQLRSQRKLAVTGYTMIDDSYYIHIKMGSISNKEIGYDVVIQFFTTDPSVKRERGLQNYKIQFFSNSPSFIYKYAALYKLNGYLIDALYSKLDPEYMEQLPEKSNPDMELMWDKSIYCACKFISENKYSLLWKTGIVLNKKLKPDKFFNNIQGFDDIKNKTELISLQKSLRKELKMDTRNSISSKMGNTRRRLGSRSTKGIKGTGTISSVKVINKVTGISKISGKSKITGKPKLSKKRKK